MLNKIRFRSLKCNRVNWFLPLLILLLSVSCKKEFPDLNTYVYGHAGESLFKNKSKYPPNTVESVKEAVILGADGVEVDIQMTIDGALVAYHDSNLEENSTGSGCINSLSLSDLQGIEVYKSNEQIDLLEDLLPLTIAVGKSLMLDVKHFNDCENTSIDYQTFNNSLNDLLANFSISQRSLLIVNSRDYTLLNSISDTNVRLSYEYDDLDKALPIIEMNEYEMLSVKLEVLDADKLKMIRQYELDLGIYNVKTRADINNALQFAPDFVISDNISCTLKALNGEE